MATVTLALHNKPPMTLTTTSLNLIVGAGSTYRPWYYRDHTNWVTNIVSVQAPGEVLSIRLDSEDGVPLPYTVSGSGGVGGYCGINPPPPSLSQVMTFTPPQRGTGDFVCATNPPPAPETLKITIKPQ